MDELISRQAAIDAMFANMPGLMFNDVLRILRTLPSAHRDAEFISWLLDEIWDEEMWELNYRAFPELLCRRLIKAGWLKEEDGKYVRLDK